MNDRFLVNALTHCATLFGDNFGWKKIMELYLILLFISIGTVRHNIEVSHCTSKSFLFKSTPLYFYVALTEDGVWMTWSLWGDCTVTCGGGLQYRNRSCDGPRYGGAECAGAGEEKRDCGENPCPSKTTAQQIWVNLVYFYSKASSKIVHVLLNRGKIINLIYSFILYRCYIFKKFSFVCELCPFCVLPLPTSCHPFISAFPPFPSRHVINCIFYPPQYTTLRLFFFHFNLSTLQTFSRRKWVILFVYIQ